MQVPDLWDGRIQFARVGLEKKRGWGENAGSGYRVYIRCHVRWEEDKQKYQIYGTSRQLSNSSALSTVTKPI